MRVIESMTTIQHNNYTCRIWRTEPEARNTYFNSDLYSTFFAAFYKERAKADFNISKVADALAAVERVSAVEIKDAEGNGTCIFPNWP